MIDDIQSGKPCFSLRSLRDYQHVFFHVPLTFLVLLSVTSHSIIDIMGATGRFNYGTEIKTLVLCLCIELTICLV
jgi:hypothetical protein